MFLGYQLSGVHHSRTRSDHFASLIITTQRQSKFVPAAGPFFHLYYFHVWDNRVTGRNYFDEGHIDFGSITHRIRPENV